MATPSEGLAFKGVRDCAIFELSTDSVSGLTYAAGFAVTVQEFSITPDINSAELPGNDVTLDLFSKAKGISGTLKNAKVHSSFLGVLLGAAVATSGTSRNIKFDADDTPVYFKMAVKIGYTGAGSASTAIFLLYKCKMDSIEFSMNQDDYATFSCNYKAIPTEWADAQGKNPIFELTVYDSDKSLLS